MSGHRTGLVAAAGDAAHFGLRVGAATVCSAADVDAVAGTLSAFDAAWVTVRALSLVPAVCNLATVGVVDYRYDFAKPDAGRDTPFPAAMPQVERIEDVRHLVTGAFLTSRFVADPRTAPAAEGLFERWLVRGVAEGRLRRYEEDGRVTGFLLWGRDADGAGRHVLAAVDPARRGHGIYSTMITASEHAAPRGAIVRGKVPVTNIGPVHALQALGYRVADLEAVVHLWT